MDVLDRANTMIALTELKYERVSEHGHNGVSYNSVLKDSGLTIVLNSLSLYVGKL